MLATKEPFSGPLYGVFQLGLVVSFIPGTPKFLQHIIFFLLVWIAHNLITKTTTGNPGVDLALGSAILTQLLNPIDNVFLTHPDTLQDIYHHQKGTITSAPLKDRIRWALNLYVNARGIGWAHESPYTPPRVSPLTTRWAFVFRQLKRAAFCILLECGAYTMNASNPFMTYNTSGLTIAPFIWRALGVGGFAAAGYARINWMHCLVSAAVVGAGLSAPERWPNLFGSPLQAWSVTRFWRFTWHQLLRKPLRAFATLITTVLYLESPPPPEKHKQKPCKSPSPSSTLSKLIWLCTAFLFSGLIHIGGESMLTGKPGFGAFTFFTLQPLAIIVEMLVAFLWRSIAAVGDTQPKSATAAIRCTMAKGNGNGNGGVTVQSEDVSISYSVGAEANEAEIPPRAWVRCVGYLWVALWFVWSLAFMIDPMVPMGMFEDPRVDLRTAEWFL